MLETLGDFRIQTVLGTGGSGVVYDAEWGPRRVALKVLHASLVATDKERAQWVAEAERLQRITHPSVVKVLAVGALPDGRPYLAMERLAGEPLATMLSRGPLAIAKALPLLQELCSAVAALHEQGLIHRDLKPENVFIVDSKHAVLLDFGIAKETAAQPSTVTQEGGVRGTPAYMAPERFFGNPACVATDVYELAVIAYAMLAGRLPWDDLGDPEARLSPRPLEGVPEALDIEIRRAMSTRPQNRPGSALELYAAIAKAAGISEPLAGETAPMGFPSQPPAPVVTQGSGPQAAPWFQGRQPTTDRGRTPLAWAPTEARPSEQNPAKKKFPVGMAVMGAVAAGGVIFGGVALWKTTGGPPQPAVAPAPIDAAVAVRDPNKPDPWSTNDAPGPSSLVKTPDKKPEPAPPPGPRTFEPSGPALTAEEYRKEAAASLVHLPGDTHFLVGVQLAELRKVPPVMAIVDKAVEDPRMKVLMAAAPPCVIDLVGASEWGVMGAQGLEKSSKSTLVIRGRWAKKDVETCFAKMEKTDGVIKLATFGRLAFIDDHTALLTNRDDLDVKALVAATSGGPAARTRKLLATLPAERSVAFVVDGEAKDTWGDIGLPAGSDVTAWVRADEGALVYDVLADTKDAAVATTLEKDLHTQTDPVFGSNQSLGKLEIQRKGGALRLSGSMTELMLSMVVSGLK